MILPDEDKHRFDAPPEPSSNERWDEPEDHCDYIDTFTDDERNSDGIRRRKTHTEGNDFMILENFTMPQKADCPSAPCSPYFISCGAAHPWSDKKCNREKGHGGEHACIEHYSGRQNEWWKGQGDE